MAAEAAGKKEGGDKRKQKTTIILQTKMPGCRQPISGDAAIDKESWKKPFTIKRPPWQRRFFFQIAPQGHFLRGVLQKRSSRGQHTYCR
jgi:hypothetical protein